jgi:hypothetical protein
LLHCIFLLQFPVPDMDRYPTLSYLALVAATFAATYVVTTI